MQRLIVLSALKRIPQNNQVIRLLQCAPIHTSTIRAYSVPNNMDKQQQKQEAHPQTQTGGNQQTGGDNQQKEETHRQQHYYKRSGYPMFYIFMTSVLGTTVLVHQLFIYPEIDFDRLTMREILFARLAQERMNKLKSANAKPKKQPAPAISYEEFVRKYGGKVQKIYFYPLENKAVAIVGDNSIVGEIVDRHRMTGQDAIFIALDRPTTEQASSIFSKVKSVYKNVFSFLALKRRTERQLGKPFCMPVHLKFDDLETFMWCRFTLFWAIFIHAFFLNTFILTRRRAYRRVLVNKQAIQTKPN